jgi:GTPase SAR1 family protein
MSAVVRCFIDRFFPNNDAGYTVTIAGLDYSGKTTLLYLLKQGEIVHTIPTMGSNIETIEASTASGRVLKFTGWDVGTGCANPRTITSLFAVHGEAMIWVVDISNLDYLRDNVEVLTSVLEDVDAYRLKDGVAAKDYPILM